MRLYFSTFILSSVADMGIETGSQGKEVIVNRIKNIKDLPKDPSLWKGNNPYLLHIDGNSYMFWKNGRAGIKNKKTGKYETENTPIVISKINTLASQAKPKSVEIKPKTAEIKSVKESTEVEIKDLKASIATSSEKSLEIDSNREIFNELRSLIRQKNPKAISNHLDSHTAQYEEFIKSEYFLGLLQEAKANPKGNALLLQLYGKYYLKDASIVVDGIYGNQTKGINKQYINEPPKKVVTEKQENPEDKREEMLQKRIEKYNSSPKEQQLSMSISAQFNKSLPNEAKNNYLKQLSLDDTLIDNLLTKEEKSQKPEELNNIRESKRKQLYNRTIRSAQSACINYLQAIFNTTINVKKMDPITLSVSNNLDPNRDTKIHDGQSIDFNVLSNGVPLKISYDLKEGTITYDASFSMNRGGINKGGQTKILSGAPSLPNLIEKGKNLILSASLSNGNSRQKIKDGIELLSKPEIEDQDKQVIEKTVAREDCMKSIKELTAYELPHDLPKETYQNTQIYMLYDIFDHTFRSDTSTAQDMYNFKYNIIEKLKNIVADYTNPQKPKFIKNLRTKYFTQEKLQQDQKDILSEKLSATSDNSLSFYSFFTQFLKDAGASENAKEYHVLDFSKMESVINTYYQKGYLLDTSLVASIERDDKKSLDNSLENALNMI